MCRIQFNYYQQLGEELKKTIRAKSHSTEDDAEGTEKNAEEEAEAEGGEEAEEVKREEEEKDEERGDEEEAEGETASTNALQQKKKLTNAFNFCERGALTITSSKVVRILFFFFCK